MYQHISEQSIYQYFGDDDPDMIRQMVEIIIDTNIKDLKELETFYEQKDYVTIKKRCHKSKPSMSYIGAEDTRNLLESIEADLESSHPINIELQQHLAVIEEELNQFLLGIDQA